MDIPGKTGNTHLMAFHFFVSNSSFDLQTVTWNLELKESIHLKKKKNYYCWLALQRATKDVNRKLQRQEGYRFPLPSTGKVGLPGQVFTFASVLFRLLLTTAETPAQMEVATGRKHTYHYVLCEYFTLETHFSFTALLACQSQPWGL